MAGCLPRQEDMRESRMDATGLLTRKNTARRDGLLEAGVGKLESPHCICWLDEMSGRYVVCGKACNTAVFSRSLMACGLPLRRSYL
eukprot:3312056-Amphidinium_carterae.1